MFKNPLASPENKAAIGEMHSNIRQMKNKAKDKKRSLAKSIASPKKNPERGHEERLHKRMMAEGDRSAEDYR